MNTLQLQCRANIKWAHAQIPVFENQQDCALESFLISFTWGKNFSMSMLISLNPGIKGIKAD